MVDRIDKLDPRFYPVQETNDERRQRQSHQEEEEDRKKSEDRDKFEKSKEVAKKLIAKAPSRSSSSSLVASNLSEKTAEISHISQIYKLEKEAKEEEEISLSFSERVLVMWGIVDARGKIRIPIIASYTIVLAVIIFSTTLLLRLL